MLGRGKTQEVGRDRRLSCKFMCDGAELRLEKSDLQLDIRPSRSVGEGGGDMI